MFSTTFSQIDKERRCRSIAILGEKREKEDRERPGAESEINRNELSSEMEMRGSEGDVLGIIWGYGYL